MKQLFTLLFAFFLYTFSYASAPDKRLIVMDGHGTSEYLIKSIRSLKFNEGFMLLNMHDGSVVELNTEYVDCLYMDDHTPSVETSIGAGEAESYIRVEGSRLYIEACPIANVLFFSSDGRILFKEQFKGAGVVELSNYMHGIYMLNVNGRTYKIINR